MEINNENQKRKDERLYFVIVSIFFVREADKLKNKLHYFLDDCALVLVDSGRWRKRRTRRSILLLLLPVWVEKEDVYV